MAAPRRPPLADRLAPSRGSASAPAPYPACPRPPRLPLFPSSRRRHTRFDCDWSSDVCSSDLTREVAADGFGGVRAERLARAIDAVAEAFGLPARPKWYEVFNGKFLPPKK